MLGNRTSKLINQGYQSKATYLPTASAHEKEAWRAKGGLISESFSLWLQSPKKGAKSRP